MRRLVACASQDGDIDCLIASDGFVWVYLNDGSGNFFQDTTNPFVNLVDISPNAMALGDIDNDGDLDVYVGNSGNNVLLINDGTGRLTEDSTSLVAMRTVGRVSTTKAVALVDYDNVR